MPIETCGDPGCLEEMLRIRTVSTTEGVDYPFDLA